MVTCPRFSRAALLAVSLLSAAAHAADPPGGGAASRPVVGESGAVLAGRYALSRSDLDVATDDLLKALAADPHNRDLRRQAFSAALLGGRPEAVKLAHDLSADPAVATDPAALLVLADQDVRAGQWAAAEAKFAALPAEGVTQVLQPLLVAWAQQGGGAADLALSTLRPFVEGTRYRGVFALHAALINDLAGHADAAAPLYRQAVVEFGSLNLRLGCIVASWQARTGHEAEARATIRAMADGNPDLAIAEPALELAAAQPQVTNAADGIAEAYVALAATLQQQQATDFSVLLLRLALDLRPGFTSARLLMSDIQSAVGQLDAASATLAPVPAADPLIAVVRMRQARLSERLGHLDDAARILEQAARENPQQPEPLSLLADMQAGQTHYAEAVATYGRAIARLPVQGADDWTLFYQRGVAYDHAHQWPMAEADFLHALSLSPDQPFVLNYLAYAWAEQGRNLPRARQMIDHAAALRPNEGAILDSLGWIMLLQGDKAGAVHWLERAVELLPEDSTVNGHLGDAYEAVGRRMEAQTQWREALILNPDPPDAAKLQAKLAGPGPVRAPSAERRSE